jgi:adenylate cyclase class 2
VPHELEAKLKVPSLDPVRERLAGADARFLRAGIECNVILDRPDRSLLEAGVGLRVRWSDTTHGSPAPATLTVKGPQLPAAFKHREELELPIEDPHTCLRMLEMLGFCTVLRYEKRRESWILGPCRVELDEPPYVGCYVEIEGPHEEAIESVRAALDLSSAPHEPRSYVSLLLDLCRSRGLDPLSLQV